MVQADAAELSESPVRRRRLRVRWPVALIGVVLSGALLWGQRAEIAYLLSPGEPILLGEEGRYQLEGLASNRFAQIRGIPTPNAAYARDGDRVFVVIGLESTPILIRREALPTEEWIPDRPPPRPDPRPFAARGRLLGREEAPQYEAAFQMLARDLASDQGRLWILLDGERPGANARVVALCALLLGFGLLNVWFLARDLAVLYLKPEA
jgi:hypothetical protein